jgi:arsenite methyltransferase
VNPLFFSSFSKCNARKPSENTLTISVKEICTFSKNSKAELLNRKASDSKNKPDEVLQALGLEEGKRVADIGAGRGYFALRFAAIIGNRGKVFAVDTDSVLLKFIQTRAKDKGLSNIVFILPTEKNVALNLENLDLIFMRNVCHHLTKRVDYFKSLRNLLADNGKIAIIEYRDVGKFSFHRLFGHYIPKERIIREMREAGLQIEEDIDFLPDQSFTIYSRQEVNQGNSAKN